MQTQVAVCKEIIDLEKFVTPKGTRSNNKPEIGGFWTSTMTDTRKSGWLEFAEKEGIYSDKQKQDLQVYHIEVANSAFILHIDTLEDFKEAIEDYGFMRRNHSLSEGIPSLDYEKLMEDYDAISVSDKASKEILELYGWDCESTVWFNIDHLNFKFQNKGLM